MSGITLTIDESDIGILPEQMEQLRTVLTGPELLEIAGRSMRDTIRAHFSELALDTLHHRTALGFGVAPTGFYEEAAQETQAPVVEGQDTVSVSVTKPGVAQRRFGGTIHGDPWLTIPARAEAVGKRATEFSNLRFILFRTDLAALVEDNQSAGVRTRRSRGALSSSENAGGLLFYWLVREVTQQPDESVLPTGEEILDPAIAQMREEIAAAFERLKPNG